MLPRNHGAFTLGKTFRRPAMTSFEGTTNLSWDAMRSTLVGFNGGRVLSFTNTMGQQRVWNPLHGIVYGGRSETNTRAQRAWSPLNGIVFGNGVESSPRTMSTTSTADLMAHSNTFDQYVLASDLQPLESSSRVVVEKPARLPSAVPVENVAIGEKQAEQSAKLEKEYKTMGKPENLKQQEIPRTTCDFQMSEEVFRAAKNAATGSAESFWSHTLYRGPEEDGVGPKIKVHYCRSSHTTERVLQQYFLNQDCLGFDIEWQPDSHKNSGPKKNVSLIQLATKDRIGLFHLALYPNNDVEGLVAPTLRRIMEDPTVTKVGVAIRADCTRLRKFLNIDSRGIFELSHLYKLVKYSSSKDFKLINRRLVSLSTQVEEHLHLPMYKGPEVRSSDWSQKLNMDQIVYAASDSYAGFQLFDTLELQRKELEPTPPRPYHVEEDKPIRLADGVEIPTDEEAEAEETMTTVSKKSSKRRQPSNLEDVSLDMDKLDPDFTISMPLPTSPPLATRSNSEENPNTTLVEAAAASANEYRASHPQQKATPSSLRCYFLWYQNPDLSFPELAALLRKIPLQTATVTNYILEATKAEKLPFEQERLKAVLDTLPKEVAAARYKTLVQACNSGGWGK